MFFFNFQRFNFKTILCCSDWGIIYFAGFFLELKSIFFYLWTLNNWVCVSYSSSVINQHYSIIWDEIGMVITSWNSQIYRLASQLVWKFPLINPTKKLDTNMLSHWQLQIIFCQFLVSSRRILLQYKHYKVHEYGR